MLPVCSVCCCQGVSGEGSGGTKGRPRFSQRRGIQESLLEEALTLPPQGLCTYYSCCLGQPSFSSSFKLCDLLAWAFLITVFNNVPSQTPSCLSTSPDTQLLVIIFFFPYLSFCFLKAGV